MIPQDSRGSGIKQNVTILEMTFQIAHCQSGYWEHNVLCTLGFESYFSDSLLHCSNRYINIEFVFKNHCCHRRHRHHRHRHHRHHRHRHHHHQKAQKLDLRRHWYQLGRYTWLVWSRIP